MKGITLEKHKSMIYFIYDLDTLIDTIDGYKPKRDTIERYGFQYDLDTLETVVQCTDTHVNMFWHGHRLTQIASDLPDRPHVFSSAGLARTVAQYTVNTPIPPPPCTHPTPPHPC